MGGSSGLEAQLPICSVPVLNTLYSFILSVPQGPTIWVPGLLGLIGDIIGFPKVGGCILGDPYRKGYSIFEFI